MFAYRLLPAIDTGSRSVSPNVMEVTEENAFSRVRPTRRQFLSAAFSSFRGGAYERRCFGINFIFSTARGLIESWKGSVKEEVEKEKEDDGGGRRLRWRRRRKTRKRRKRSGRCERGRGSELVALTVNDANQKRTKCLGSLRDRP